MKRDTAAIIVAGGKGLRFGGRVRKQYLLLNGHPILWWSIRAFQRSPSIGEIIVVVPAGDPKRFGASIRVLAGGSTRSESVRNGLAAVSDRMRYVSVHDAVRPLVTPQIIENVIQAARKHKAALAACPSRDTVKIADGRDFVRASPPRETVWLAQTPQVFERRLLMRAHANGRGAVTDDAQLVERLGIRVKLVESPAENIKVTVPADIKIAKVILNGRGGRLPARR